MLKLDLNKIEEKGKILELAREFIQENKKYNKDLKVRIINGVLYLI